MAVDLYYREFGHRKTILILHGLFGSSSNWNRIANQLASNYHVFTLDLRNHGRSQHAQNMSYQDMAADVFQFISEHHLTNVNVMGHSMGGKVAMMLALTYPKLIDKLIIVDIAPVTYQHCFDEFFAVMNEVERQPIVNREAADLILKKKITTLGIRQFILQNLVKTEHDFKWRFNLPVIENHVSDIVGFPDCTGCRFEGSTYFLHGHDSDYMIDDYHVVIDQFFPNARIEGVDHAGHWIHAEQPELFIKKTLTFID